MVGWMSKKDFPLLRKIGILPWGVDYVIDRMRTKYNVIIYHRAPPFLDYSGKIMYNFNAKYCNPKMGWKSPTYINMTSEWDSNIYEAKRRAIRAAARWILAHKCQKVSIKSAKK